MRAPGSRVPRSRVSRAGIPGLLAAHLQTAVPVRISELRSATGDRRERLASIAAEVVAAHGDLILRPGAPRSEIATAVNWLVTGLACAAYLPGGTRFGHLAWCAAHPAHRWAGHGPCAACLTAENLQPEPGI